MKTNYLPRSRSQFSSRKKLIFAIVAIFVFGSIIFSMFNGALVNVVSPLWRTKSAFTDSAKSWLDFFSSKDALIRENQMLKETIANDQILLTAAQATEASNEALLATLGRAPAKSKGIAASVLVSPPTNPYDILIIDVGTDEGVKAGSTVSLSTDLHGPTIGKVFETLNHTSKVKLYSSSGEQTPAVLERGNIPVTLLGQGGGNFEFNLPKTSNVVVGDRVLASGVSGSLLGVVGSISSTETDSFKKVLVASPESVYSLRFVLVTP